MKFIFLFLILFQIHNTLTKENISSTKTNYIKKTVKPKEEIKFTEEDEENGFYSPDKIYELNDISFDYIIRDGTIYRWFIIFYSRSCGHCRRAKKEISKIFNDYKNISNLRFAQIEAYQNIMTNVRFNISGVPYMILIENDSIYEMELFPNYENLKDFIFTNFSDVEDELKPIPRKVKFAYVAWLILKQNLDDLTENVNKFLKNKNIKFQFNTLGFVILLICIIILTCWGIIHLCLKICCNDEDIALEIKKLEEHFNKVNKAKEEEKKQQEKKEEEEEEEYEIEEEEEDDEGEEVENNKEMTEEEKKKKIEEEKEKEKENEQKDKEDKIENNKEEKVEEEKSDDKKDKKE